MKKQDLLTVIDKYLDGTASKEEQDLLNRYFESFQQMAQWTETELGDGLETEAIILQKLTAAIQPKPAKVAPFYQQYWVKAAAAFLVLLATVLWLTKGEKTEPIAAIEQSKNEHIALERHATLILANGAVMVLDSTPDGVLVHNENTIIRKQGKSITVDLPAASGGATASGFNALKVPHGQQYKAVLSDGSQVWLNTASTLRFPAVFAADERRVEVSGEAYFDVTKDATKPFRVLAVAEDAGTKCGTVVEVLGTQFNINAYGDEGLMKTTLLKGSVKVAPAEKGYALPSGAAVLLPGEQAQISSSENASETVSVKKTDVEEVLAWKSNEFHFNNTDLQSIMRQLARWYSVEVVYANKVPVRHFSGKISRAAPLSTVLEILEQSNIRFRLRGNQIIVKA